MASLNLLVGVSLVYVAFLFAVAFAAERAAVRGRSGWLRTPLVYTLSLSIYCTAWTFYGAVGYAARSGMEYVTIYLGPSLVMIGWWWVLRKLVRIGRSQRVTSVADLISARYGKSNTLAIVVTLMAVVGVTPYIALQLQSVTLALSIFSGPPDAEGLNGLNPLSAGFWVAGGLAVFTVLFVENDDERHVQIASWAFPVYLMLMSLFVVPIAVVGLNLLPAGSNPDLFVVSIPLAQGQTGLAVLSFLGGFSSATSMVIVATLALSTMVSNHVVMPIYLSLKPGGASMSGDVRNVILLARRLSILLIIALGYVYYVLSGGSGALAAIGLISFAGVAQFLPAMLGGIFWRGATRMGALSGLCLGFAIWVYASLLPSFGQDAVLPASFFDVGPFGINWLRPYAFFGIDGMDPTVHAVFWSLLLNTGVFIVMSLLTFPKPLERLQGAQFVNVFDHSGQARGWHASVAASEDLMIMAQRILGASEAQALFRAAARAQGMTGHLPEPTPAFLERLERELSASVGTATAHAMVSQMVGAASVSVEDLLAVADESAQMLEYSSQLEAKSAELSRTAGQLREANEKLTQLSVQKDAFLGQISHELRTPMTSIRAFSEIMRDAEGLSVAEKTKYASIIHVEAIRLTRLLDDLLDLSVLENGQVSLNSATGPLEAVLDHAVITAQASGDGRLRVTRDTAAGDTMVTTDLDRLGQVFINLITNAQKYCRAAAPHLEISVHADAERLAVEFRDNGTPIPDAARALIFEKFARVAEGDGSGAGLGLAICREIMARLGGDITHVPQAAGNVFVVQIPRRQMSAGQ